MTTAVTRVGHHTVGALLAAGTFALAQSYGGYYPRVWGWAALVLLVAAVGLGVRGLLPRLRSPAALTIGATLALAAWAYASRWWALHSSHLAWEESARLLLYAAALTVGAGALAAPRAWSTATTYIGASLAAVCALTLARMAMSEQPLGLFSGYRVDAPIGYVNGLAAVAMLALLLLAGRAVLLVRGDAPGGDPPVVVRAIGGGLCVAGMTAAACLLVAVQSRGVLLAGSVGALVAVVLVPARITLGVVLVPVAAAVAWAADALSAPFVAVGDLVRSTWELDNPQTAPLQREAVRIVHDAGAAGLVAMAIGFVGGVIITLIGARHVGRTPAGGVVRARPSWLRWVGAVGVVVVLAVLLVPLPSRQSPVAWSVEQVRGCLRAPAEVDRSAETRSSHLTDVGTNRCDFWRVALSDARAHPVRGIGANNFQGSYAAQGRSSEIPKQPHSLVLQLLGELGVVGLLLGAVALGPVVWAAWRFATSGPRRDPTFALGIAAIAYWLVHASIDWLWNIPAVTLPPLVLAGGLVACLSPAATRAPRLGAALLAGGVALVGVALIVPIAVGDALLHRSEQAGQTDAELGDALDDAEASARTDQTWALPVVRQAEVLAAMGRSTEARAAARKALQLEPRTPAVRARARNILGRSVDDSDAEQN